MTDIASTFIALRTWTKRLCNRLTTTVWGSLLLFVWFGKNVLFYFLLFRKIGLISLLLLGSLVPGTCQTTSLDKAKSWYSNRSRDHYGIYATAKPIDSAIFYYKAALKEDPYSEVAAIGMMESYYFKCTYVRLSKAERIQLTEDALREGEYLALIHPESGPLLYWLASIWGQWVNCRDVLKACKEDVPGKIRSITEKVIVSSPEYRSKGGNRILGLVHLHTPRIPFIYGWPSIERSMLLLEIAARENPEHLGNLMALAKVYEKMDRMDERNRLLWKVIGTEPRTEFLLEDLTIIHEANSKLGKISIQ